MIFRISESPFMCPKINRWHCLCGIVYTIVEVESVTIQMLVVDVTTFGRSKHIRFKRPTSSKKICQLGKNFLPNANDAVFLSVFSVAIAFFKCQGDKNHFSLVLLRLKI